MGPADPGTSLLGCKKAFLDEDECGLRERGCQARKGLREVPPNPSGFLLAVISRQKQPSGAMWPCQALQVPVPFPPLFFMNLYYL